jgi:hypothetical protein
MSFWQRRGGRTLQCSLRLPVGLWSPSSCVRSSKKSIRSGVLPLKLSCWVLTLCRPTACFCMHRLVQLCGLFPASDSSARVLVPATSSPLGLGSWVLSLLVLGGLWDIPILVMDSLVGPASEDIFRAIFDTPPTKSLIIGADSLLTMLFLGGLQEESPWKGGSLGISGISSQLSRKRARLGILGISDFSGSSNFSRILDFWFWPFHELFWQDFLLTVTQKIPSYRDQVLIRIRIWVWRALSQLDLLDLQSDPRFWSRIKTRRRWMMLQYQITCGLGCLRWATVASPAWHAIT